MGYQLQSPYYGMAGHTHRGGYGGGYPGSRAWNYWNYRAFMGPDFGLHLGTPGIDWEKFDIDKALSDPTFADGLSPMENLAHFYPRAYASKTTGSNNMWEY